MVVLGWSARPSGMRATAFTFSSAFFFEASLRLSSFAATRALRPSCASSSLRRAALLMLTAQPASF